MGAGLVEFAPVVEPAPFMQAVVVGLPWQVIERVPQEVHVAALVCGAGQHLADRRAQAGRIVGDDELGAMQAPVPQAQQALLPCRGPVALGPQTGRASCRERGCKYWRNAG